MKIKRTFIDPDTARDYHFEDDPAIFAEFEERLMMGEPIYTICADPMMPSRRETFAHIGKETPIGLKLIRARELGMSAMIDRTLEIADKATTINYKVADIRIKTRLAAIAKIAPRKYGDLLTIDAKNQTSAVTKVVIVNDPERDDTDAEEASKEGTESDL